MISIGLTTVCLCNIRNYHFLHIYKRQTRVSLRTADYSADATTRDSYRILIFKFHFSR